MRRPLTAASVLLFSAAALATPTKSVRVTTYQDFAEGQTSGVLLSSQGEARSGFATRRLALPTLGDDSVRALCAGPGGILYLGTSGEVPSVFSYTQGTLKKLAQLDAGTWVTAISTLGGSPQGGRSGPEELLAATAQDGRIFRVRPDGKSEVVAQLEAEHVWALLHDGQAGVTYATTGPGALWALADADLVSAGTGRKPGRGHKLFESDARQFLSLDRGEDGALYVGTADDAVLYRVEPGGGGRAVHDFAGNEVRAIAHYKDVLYVAVNDMQRGDTAASRGTKIVTPPAGSAPGVKPAPTSGSTAPTNPSPIEKKGKGALYRIDASGRVEQLHAITDGFFNALVVDADGNLFAAASTPGGRGRLYWVAPQGQGSGQAALTTVYTALEVKESDVLALSIGPAGRFVGTGNSGALYTLAAPAASLEHAQAPAGAYYLSKPFYAQAPSRWGSLRFAGDGAIYVETRSGNLAKPDGSWSGWQLLQGVTRQPSTAEQVGKIASPSGRYLQVRASFAGQAVLRDFTFYYQPINQRPRVTEILVGEDASGRVARGPRTQGPLRPRSPVVKLRWKVENPDEDDLNYRVYLRPADKAQKAAAPGSPYAGWLRLGGPDPSVPLLRTELDWNTEAVADGLYELKVVVTDERSNPAELALTHELLSPPFLIDNKRPEVRDLAWNAATATLSGRAVDATSPIAELAYSLDGGDFYPLGPRDGVLDDLSEEFAARLLRLAAGPHTLLVRTSDAADNSATAQLVIVSP